MEIAKVSSGQGSGSRTLVERKFGADRGPQSRGRLDGHAAEEERDTFLHTDETARIRCFQDDLRFEAATPVLDMKVEHARVGPDAHGYTGHTGTACDIG